MMTTTRGLLIVTVLLAVAFWAMPVQSQSQAVYEGQILSLSVPGMIAINDGSGREWMFAVAPETVIRRNSRPVKLGDLRIADSATVLANDNKVAILIEAKSRL